MDPKLSLPACERADNGAMWMAGNLLELPGTAEESSFVEEGCMVERLTLLSHQRAQASLSTGAWGFRMSSVESKSMSAWVGSLVTTPPAVLVDLAGSLGEKVRRNLPGSELTSIWEGVQGLRDDGGVTEEMGEVVPRGWRDREFRPEELSASGSSDRQGAVRPVPHIAGRTSHRCAPAGGDRPGNRVSQEQELPRGYERGRQTLNASYQPRSSCT